MWRGHVAGCRDSERLKCAVHRHCSECCLSPGGNASLGVGLLVHEVAILGSPLKVAPDPFVRIRARRDSEIARTEHIEPTTMSLEVSKQSAPPIIGNAWRKVAEGDAEGSIRAWLSYP